MNKYLLLSAAALAASAGSIATPLRAATLDTRIGFSGYCDGLQLYSNDLIVFVSKHLYTGCGWSSSQLSIGIAGKNKAFNEVYGGGKKFVNFSFSTMGTAYAYEIQLPIATGNHWTGFLTSNATSAWEFNAGTYYTGYNARKGSLASKPPSNKAVKDKAGTKKA